VLVLASIRSFQSCRNIDEYFSDAQDIGLATI
jgi:hypothetical protein